MRTGIGIDIGGTSIRAARVSEAGEILAHDVRSTPATPADTIALIDAMIGEVDDQSCTAIGVGVPGRVDVASGEVFSGGFVNLAGRPLAARLGATRGRVVFADNDAGMALVAEARIGAGCGAANIVLLTIGTGIGGATMLDGQILRGARMAGQLGHITIDVNGPVCPCGRSGCLETLSSGTALRRLTAEAKLPAATRLHDIIARDDPVSQSILARWAGPLRAGIDSLVATLDPDIVLLGGGLGADAFAALQRFPPLSQWFQCKIAPAALGDRAGVIGAALAALERAS
jgi:glucokinase